jgi:hypothetical protein
MKVRGREKVLEAKVKEFTTDIHSSDFTVPA